jgi:hypothetical protein
VFEELPAAVRQELRRVKLTMIPITRIGINPGAAYPEVWIAVVERARRADVRQSTSVDVEEPSVALGRSTVDSAASAFGYGAPAL